MSFLRNMLKEQICQADTSVDPMTVVSRGAAIYASTFDVSAEIKDEIRDTSKVQLDLSYESQSVDTEEMLVVKVDSEKTDGDIPSKIFWHIPATPEFQNFPWPGSGQHQTLAGNQALCPDPKVIFSVLKLA